VSIVFKFVIKTTAKYVKISCAGFVTASIKFKIRPPLGLFQGFVRPASLSICFATYASACRFLIYLFCQIWT
jgi:hypothetical protein